MLSRSGLAPTSPIRTNVNANAGLPVQVPGRQLTLLPTVSPPVTRGGAVLMGRGTGSACVRNAVIDGFATLGRTLPLVTSAQPASPQLTMPSSPSATSPSSRASGPPLSPGHPPPAAPRPGHA